MLREFKWRLVNGISRALEPDESVHHKNGDRMDNRIENLELWSRWQPCGQRVHDKVKYALEILERYLPEALAAQLVVLYDGASTGAQMDEDPKVAATARAIAVMLIDAATASSPSTKRKR